MQTSDQIVTVRDRSREATKEIRRYIKDAITTSRLKPGDKLPTEREFVLRFKAGRNTVRKTLIALEEEGWLTRHVGRGTFVLPRQMPETAAAPGVPLGACAARALPATDIAKGASPLDLMELRIALEPNVTALAVQRATPADIERMNGYIERSRTAETLQEFEDLDDALHRTIATATRNPLFMAISEMITTLRNEAEWGSLKKRTLTRERRDGHTREHVAIVRAIHQRDADAAEAAMTNHLVNVRRMMFEREHDR